MTPMSSEKRWSKYLFGMVLAMAMIFLLAGCGTEDTKERTSQGTSENTAERTTESTTENLTERIPEETAETLETEGSETMLKLTIGETPVTVEWEDNESVEALKALCQDGPLTIQMSMYGGFEQVGRIGQSLPRKDVQTTTEAGDIVLYSGNQIVIFYGSNSWAYTRLGHVSDKSEKEMAELLGNGDVTITLECERR